MIKDIQELNFPKIDGKQYATLSQADVSLQDMGEKSITAQIEIDGELTPDFSFDWEVAFKGEKYIMPLRQPQGSKEGTSLNSKIDLTFQHWAVYQLKRWYFFDYVSQGAGTMPIISSYNVPLQLNLKDFCEYLSNVCLYYFGDKITVDFNDPAKYPDTGWQYSDEKAPIEINNSYVWDVIIKLYELYTVHWWIEPNGDIDHYVIKIGYPTSEISHIFKYGFDGGLMKVERQVQDDNIRNMIIGRGGNKNLPYRYFKKHDENNKTFSPDPDWIPELANIPFTELHGATFRSYVHGWKAKHITEYRDYYKSHQDEYKTKYGYDYPADEVWIVTTPTADDAYAPWAWTRGYTDTKFNPVEFVADAFNINDSGYGVENGSSIAKYGELMGGLENNEDIYPTIQGVEIDPYGRIDECVDVEEITSNDTDIDVNANNDAKVETLPAISLPSPTEFGKLQRLTLRTTEVSFIIPEGKYGDFDEGVKEITISKYKTVVALFNDNGHWSFGEITTEIPIGENDNVIIEDAKVIVTDIRTGEEMTASGIPSGEYSAYAQITIYNPTDSVLTVDLKCKSPKLVTATPNPVMGNTWDIWIKNIFDSQKDNNETDLEYVNRIWTPIMGDKEKNEAKIVFSDGMLAMSQDYKFTIVKGGVHYDTSKTLYEFNDGTKSTDSVNAAIHGGIKATYPSHWRLTLGKCDADLESIGVLQPSVERQAVAGDHFFFIGIDMPHMYVLKAEERLDNWKTDELVKIKDVKPTWVVSLDKVRMFNYGNPDALIDEIAIGKIIRLADKRFILTDENTEKSYITLYLQALTYKYTAPTDKDANILPDIEVTLSDEYTSNTNSVSQLNGEVSALQKQIGSVSSIDSLIKSVGDNRYIRKDISDVAAGRVNFIQGLDCEKYSKFGGGAQFGQSFADGLTGFGGKIDEYGDGWLGGLHLRSFLEVPELRYNRTEISIGNTWNAPGGGVIESVNIDSTTTGTITLHLEPGEIGAVAVGDLCQGIFHDSIVYPNNATQDKDDGRGNFMFAGFCTVYFEVTEIVRSGDNSVVKYSLRPTSERWTNTYHPCEQMKFVCYGNVSDTARQTSRYATRTYERYLKGVNTWEIGADNIGAQFGDLSNLSLWGMNMTGYSAYLNNIYMTGRIEQLVGVTPSMQLKYDNDNFLPEGKTKELNCNITIGWEDVTKSAKSWSIERITDVQLEDEYWNRSDKAELFNGTFTFTHDDLGGNESALFVISARVDGVAVNESLLLRAAPQGEQGCVYRVTQWQLNKEYHNDNELSSDGIRYIDVILIPNSSLASKAIGYICKTTHTSSVTNAPGSETGNAYWDEMNSLAPILTPLLIADGAIVTLLQSNQVRVMKDDGSTVNVGLGGGEFPLWIGSQNPTDANFYVDDAGRAHMTEAEISGKVISGVLGGKHVEIQPDNQAMKIYNDEGVEASSFEGNTYNSILDILGNESSIPKPFSVTQPSGYKAVAGKVDGTNSYNDEFNISGSVYTDGITEVKISGKFATTYTQSTDPTPNPQADIITPPLTPEVVKSASARIWFYLDTYSDASLKVRTNSQLIVEYNKPNSSVTLQNHKVRTTTGGYHVLRIKISISATGAMMSATASWGDSVTSGWAITASSVNDFYMSKFFANGFCLGQSVSDYVMVYNQVAGGMKLIMENNGYGVAVSDKGIQVKHHEGSWMGLPLLVFSGKVNGASTDAGCSIDKYHSFNNKTPSITRISQGVYRLTYPSTWMQSLSMELSSLIINVTSCTSLISANILEQTTSSYIDIELSRSGTRQDGSFIINISHIDPE